MNVKNYIVKLMPLSPIHIGTGEAYEPTNYVIDKEDEKNYLYAFDEFLFFKKLSDKDKIEFSTLFNTAADALSILKIQKFFKDRALVAKQIAYKKVIVSPDVASEYEKKIGRFAQKEQGRINQMIIEKTYVSPNLNKALILGSSLKGAIATAFGVTSIDNLLIADSEIINSNTFVDEAKNIKRKQAGDGGALKTKMEVISALSKFKTTFGLKNGLDISELIEFCNRHYLPIFKSQFGYETDENTRANLSKKFVEKFEKFIPNKNQFLLRIGKHSGARAVTIDGQRRIWNIKAKKDMSEETTTWIINKQPFGWLLCEVEF